MNHPVLNLPDPNNPTPIPSAPRTAFLKPHITDPSIIVGDYTYYDDPDGVDKFQHRNVLYHFPGSPDRLIIGKFCALATATTFLMNGGNHRLDGPSTYPFPIFGAAWAEHLDLLSDLPSRGDTVVGHDVWLGWRSAIMPGITIGHGAIIASASVVVKDVPPYAIVAGNPAKVIKMRFDETTVARLLAIAWWDWPVEKITQHIPTIMAGDAAGLETAACD